jgi:hypothetical protein
VRVDRSRIPRIEAGRTIEIFWRQRHVIAHVTPYARVRV